jgi:hypothetical protein
VVRRIANRGVVPTRAVSTRSSISSGWPPAIRHMHHFPDIKSLFLGAPQANERLQYCVNSSNTASLRILVVCLPGWCPSRDQASVAMPMAISDHIRSHCDVSISGRYDRVNGVREGVKVCPDCKQPAYDNSTRGSRSCVQNSFARIGLCMSWPLMKLRSAWDAA